MEPTYESLFHFPLSCHFVSIRLATKGRPRRSHVDESDIGFTFMCDSTWQNLTQVKQIASYFLFMNSDKILF